MRKIIVLLILFLVSVSSLVGCVTDTSVGEISKEDISNGSIPNKEIAIDNEPIIDSNNNVLLVINDDKNEAELLDNANNDLDELDGVWIETEYEVYEEEVTSIRVKWYNRFNDTMIFGQPFILEEKENGTWEKVSKETNINYGFTLEGLILGSNETRWHTYHLIPYTDGLSSGEYRISTTFMRETLDGKNYGAGNYSEYQVYGYFTVADKKIKRDLTVLDDTKIEYLNENYHFAIYLPKEWEGLQISTAQETGDKDLDDLFSRIDEEFIIMNIRHPKWTKELPYQDISFVIFRSEQWNKNVANAVDGDFDSLPLDVPGGGSKYIIRLNSTAYDSSLYGHKEVLEIVGDSYFNSFVHDY